MFNFIAQTAVKIVGDIDRFGGHRRRFRAAAQQAVPGTELGVDPRRRPGCPHRHRGVLRPARASGSAGPDPCRRPMLLLVRDTTTARTAGQREGLWGPVGR